jgi:hypothetical protein
MLSLVSRCRLRFRPRASKTRLARPLHGRWLTARYAQTIWALRDLAAVSEARADSKAQRRAASGDGSADCD